MGEKRIETSDFSALKEPGKATAPPGSEVGVGGWYLQYLSSLFFCCVVHIPAMRFKTPKPSRACEAVTFSVFQPDKLPCYLSRMCTAG